MTIEDLGSLGELLAAIATIATLFYLARQIRQGSDVTLAASQQTLVDDLERLVRAAPATSPDWTGLFPFWARWGAGRNVGDQSPSPESP